MFVFWVVAFGDSFVKFGLTGWDGFGVFGEGVDDNNAGSETDDSSKKNAKSNDVGDIVVFMTKMS